MDHGSSHGTLILNWRGKPLEEFQHIAEVFLEAANDPTKKLKRNKHFGIHGIPLEDFRAYPVVYLYRHAPPEIVVSEVTAAGLTHVRTTANWSAESQPAMLFLTLFRKGGQQRLAGRNGCGPHRPGRPACLDGDRGRAPDRSIAKRKTNRAARN